MNEQESQMALIQAKQEALDWQEKYMNQRQANEKQAEKIVRQAARIAELEQLYSGVVSKENARKIEGLANTFSAMLQNLQDNLDRSRESVEKQVELFKKG